MNQNKTISAGGMSEQRNTPNPSREKSLLLCFSCLFCKEQTVIPKVPVSGIAIIKTHTYIIRKPTLILMEK
ncbi:MAG: hypothetical protein ACRC2T_04515 [Thermoguttaceae bacterium]